VAKVADVLTMEYMSSDESEMDEETHGLNSTTFENLLWKAEN
jgi:hypothetical protein